jgi:REP element-mobilizing transposase RayT
LLLTAWHEFKFEGLEALHSLNYILVKGVSSSMIRQKNYPSILKKLWGNALWSPSYFAGSCGGAPIEVIRQYIEQQQTPH